MKNSNPISLFSFQDIITSLTGIMIVVVLIIVLELVETMSVAAMKSKLKPEYDIAKKNYDACVQQWEDLKKQQKKMKEAKKKLTLKSETALMEDLQKESLYSNELVKKNNVMKNQLEQLRKVRQSLQEEIRRLNAELKKMDQGKIKLNELQSKLIALKKRQQQVDHLIHKKSKMVQIEFSGINDRTPILIECNGWGFRAQIYPSGPIRQFGIPGKTALSRQISDLVDWLQQQNFDQAYPVLLFKEESLVFHDKIVERIQKLSPNIVMGREPITAGEECFSHE